MTIVEGDLFGVVEQVRVACSVLTFQFLLNRDELAKSGRDHANDHPRAVVPQDHHQRSFPSDQLRKLLREENDVHDGFRKIEVERGAASRPLLEVLRQSLVRVRNTVVEVADFVIEHLLQVLVVEVLGHLSTD